MRQAQGLGSPRKKRPRSETGKIELRDSGIVPARNRTLDVPAELPRPATVLKAGRADVSRFGASIAGAGDLLLVGGRIDDIQPFAAQYRMTKESAVRERYLRGTAEHRGPNLATDGERIIVGEPREGGRGFSNIYRRRTESLTLETTLEARSEASEAALPEFGGSAAVGADLLVLGHSASVSVYRHSAVGWLSAGSLRPELPYGYNPQLGRALGVLGSRVLVGNPVEVEGHRRGPGRVFVFRQQTQGCEPEGVLTGVGIEVGREEQDKLGFGATISVAGEFAVVTAPHELSGEGGFGSRVYVYRVLDDALTCVSTLSVLSCQSGACIAADRLFVLGDALYVFGRQGQSFRPLAAYRLAGAEAITACGELIALSYPSEQRVALHFAAQL